MDAAAETVKIRITPAASAHLTSVYDYLSAASSKVAAAQLQKIFEGIDQLKLFPESAPRGRKEGTRELTIPNTPFIVAYAIDRDLINILAILHGSQRWPRSF